MLYIGITNLCETTSLAFTESISRVQGGDSKSGKRTFPVYKRGAARGIWNAGQPSQGRTRLNKS